MNPSEWVWGVVGLFLTVMILSYLIGDNFLFRVAAHLFVGLTSGFIFVLIINQILWPYLINPLSTGTWTDRLWLMVPLVLIILLFLSQAPRFKGLGSIPLAYLGGLTAAIVVGGAVFGTLIPQSWSLIEAFDPARWYREPGQTWLRIVDASVMLIGTLSTLSYFHFGQKLKTKHDQKRDQRPLVFEALSKIGQVFIGITLGAVFAGVFSSALLALIDRIIFINQFFVGLLGGG